MRYLVSFCLVIVCLAGEAALAKEKNCSDFLMLGIGPQTNQQGCLKGDVIRVPYKRAVELCDFNKAIACDNDETRLTCYCAYIGTTREKR